METNKKAALGDTVKDRITGFKGTVIAFTTWLNGCERCTVQPNELTKEGKCKETETIDIQQLEVIKRANKVLPEDRPGGPFPQTPRGHK